jgi:hypothetical protein
MESPVVVWHGRQAHNPRSQNSALATREDVAEEFSPSGGNRRPVHRPTCLRARTQRPGGAYRRLGLHHRRSGRHGARSRLHARRSGPPSNKRASAPSISTINTVGRISLNRVEKGTTSTARHLRVGRRAGSFAFLGTGVYQLERGQCMTPASSCPIRLC